MAKTSKSPKRILQVAHALGKQRLRTYSHKFSPKKFTLPQLFACLVLKEFMRLDYRKLSTLLKDAPSLAGVIELEKIPHFSTFQKAAAHTDRTCEAMSGWHSATAGSRVGATSILVAYGVAALIGESGLAGEWSAVGKSA